MYVRPSARHVTLLLSINDISVPLVRILACVVLAIGMIHPLTPQKSCIDNL